MTLLHITGLNARYDRNPVLCGIDLTVPETGFVAVVGANTAGKSTLLRCISRLIDRVEGQMRFDGHDLMTRQAHQVAGLGIAHVPEGRHVFPDMSVEENLSIGGYARRKSQPSFQADFDDIYQLFPRLRERRKQSAGTLSGGEQQMVALGRALMLKPRLLLLDEPSHGLAPKVVEELHQAMLDIHAKGIAILLVEQNTRLALSVTHQAYVLQSGKIVLSGPSADLLEDGRIRAAYLGI